MATTGTQAATPTTIDLVDYFDKSEYSEYPREGDYEKAPSMHYEVADVAGPQDTWDVGLVGDAVQGGVVGNGLTASPPGLMQSSGGDQQDDNPGAEELVTSTPREQEPREDIQSIHEDTIESMESTMTMAFIAICVVSVAAFAAIAVLVYLKRAGPTKASNPCHLVSSVARIKSASTNPAMPAPRTLYLNPVFPNSK